MKKSGCDWVPRTGGSIESVAVLQGGVNATVAMFGLCRCILR
jgi:hypothetical protein